MENGDWLLVGSPVEEERYNRNERRGASGYKYIFSTELREKREKVKEKRRSLRWDQQSPKRILFSFPFYSGILEIGTSFVFDLKKRGP